MTAKLEDVANRARVSLTTAQRAMRGDRRVRASTRQHIEKTARELGYQPNVAARQLKKQLRQNVGLVVACQSEDSASELYLSEYAQFISVLAGCLGQCEHNLMISTTEEMVGACNVDQMLPRIVGGGYVNKLVVLSDMWPHFADELRKLRIPTVVVDGPDCGLSSVQIDESHAAEMLTERFVEMGHRRIAFCNHVTMPDEQDRHRTHYRDSLWPRGYLKAITRHQLTPVPGWDEFPESIDTQLDRLLALDNPPTGIIAYDDQMAHVMTSELMLRGVRVPQQISVAALRSRGFGPYVRPMISHMAAPLDLMARRVCQMLVDDDCELLDSTSQVYIEPGYFEGETLGRAPGT